MKLHACLLCLFTMIFNVVGAQDESNADHGTLNTGYYVVVAAFKAHQQDYAERYSSFLEGKASVAAEHKPIVTNKAEVLVAGPPLAEPKVATEIERSSEVAAVAPVVVASEATPAMEASTISKPSLEKEVGAQQSETSAVAVAEEMFSFAETPVFFSLYNATNNRVIEGEVQIIDAERNVVLKKVKGNDYELLPNPKSKTGKLILVADIFGYRKVQLTLDYNQQIKSGSEYYDKIFGNLIVLDFDMVRYRRGDIATLYNVYFFKDAAVMLPDSQYELNSLLAMMKEKPYKVMLHGHTNGNARGKIISMGEDQNFFSINGDVKEGYGSAKELSRKRAETIKNWLVANGIDANRIEITAWGGKRMIHDRHSNRAKHNVRVEVEVLEDGV